MHTPFDIDNALLEQAADWHVQLRSDAADATLRSRFAAWQAADPRHRLAYAEVSAVAWALPNVALPTAGISPRHGRAAAGRLPRRFTGWVAGALAVLCVALLLPLLGEPLSAVLADHAAPRAQRYSAALADGSRIELDALSRLDVALAADARRLRLKSGALFIDVARDPARPLSVEAGGVVVTAIGTRFGVRMAADAAVEVAVEEGRVAVAHAGTRQELIAGQVLRLGDGRGVRALDPDVLAWRRGRLVFVEQPLGAVLAELARHAPAPVWGLARVDDDTPLSLSLPSEQALATLQAVLAERGHRLQPVAGLGYVVR